MGYYFQEVRRTPCRASLAYLWPSVLPPGRSLTPTQKIFRCWDSCPGNGLFRILPTGGLFVLKASNMLRMVSATEQMLINVSYYSLPFTSLTVKVSQGIEPETPCLCLCRFTVITVSMWNRFSVHQRHSTPWWWRCPTIGLLWAEVNAEVCLSPCISRSFTRKEMQREKIQCLHLWRHHGNTAAV